MRFMTQVQINGLMGEVNIVKQSKNPKDGLNSAQ